MIGPAIIEIPRFQLGRGENQREHWTVRAKRVQAERWRVWLAWARAETSKKLRLPPPPWHVTLVRCTPSGGTDFVNMCGSLKATQDQVAEQLKLRDDRDAKADELDRATWTFKEDTGTSWAVRIEIRTRLLPVPPQEITG